MTATLLAILLAAAALCPTTLGVTETELRRAALKAGATETATPEEITHAARITCGYGSRRAGRRLLHEARDWRGR